MILCSITPKGHYDWMYRNSHAMLLAHLSSDADYVNESLKHDDVYKICDNSMIEMGEAFTIDKVYEAARKLKANEIILPDAYPNGPETIQKTDEALSWIRVNNLVGEFNLMGVCHGENEEDFKKTFDYLNSQDEITCIGIPKVVSTWAKNRSNLSHIWMNTDKDIHYLGSWYSLKELIELPSELFYKVRTCDTCLPSYYAITDTSVLSNRRGTIELDKEYPELTEEKYNNVMKEYMNYINV